LASFERFAGFTGHECRGRQGVNSTLHQDVSAADQVMHTCTGAQQALLVVAQGMQHITYPAVATQTHCALITGVGLF